MSGEAGGEQTAVRLQAAAPADLRLRGARQRGREARAVLDAHLARAPAALSAPQGIARGHGTASALLRQHQTLAGNKERVVCRRITASKPFWMKRRKRRQPGNHRHGI